MKNVAVIYNAAAGKSAPGKPELESLLESIGLRAYFVDIGGDVRKQLAKGGEATLTAIVAAGGDGTVHTAANEAVRLSLPLAVLPVGTLNHFAKDLHIPLELADAARYIASARPSKIDYATLNGEIFVNNSSIGVYPGSLGWRERLSRYVGKWPAAFIGLCTAWVHAPRPRLVISVGAEQIRTKTPYVFIGNNAYSLKSPVTVARETLTGHTLFYQIFNADSIRSFISRKLSPRVDQPVFISDQTTQTIIIGSSRKSLKVSVDGEVRTMSTPLTYELRPDGLKVLVAPNAQLA